jgi:hypothetical protein
MIDLDKVWAVCMMLITGGIIVLATHLVTMRVVSSDIDDWHDLAVSSQAAAAECVTVLERVDAGVFRLP